MKAAYITRTGPPEVITYGDLPTPKPGPTECLVKVAAVDMNPIYWRPSRAWGLSARVDFPKESAFQRQNEFKDLVVGLVI